MCIAVALEGGRWRQAQQKRLDSCALALPKWAKAGEKLGTRACGTLKIDDLVADIAFRVENAHENGQNPQNTKLLVKYLLKVIV